MLSFLAFINFVNLFFWVLWAIRMRNRKQCKFWVMKKWLNQEGFTPNERKYMADFAEIFKFGNLLLFYYIEAHTDRTVASAFCTALFQRWLEIRITDEIMPSDNRVVIHMPEPLHHLRYIVRFLEENLFCVTRIQAYAQAIHMLVRTYGKKSISRIPDA
jgi:hypothetical protein